MNSSGQSIPARRTDGVALEPKTDHGKAAVTSGTTCLHVVLLSLVCASLFLPALATLPLMNPDETRCAQLVQSMVRDGQWIVPHLRGKPYFEKPAPFFWLAAAGEAATGDTEVGGRLVAALAAWIAVLTTYFYARRVFGIRGGLIAATVLATGVLFLFMARWYRMDMPFAAAMWAAVWCFWRAENLPTATRRKPAAGERAMAWRWVGFYGFAAVATLMKGPTGAAMPLTIVATYLVASRQWRRLKELANPPGLVVLLLAAAPWYVMAELHQPGFLHHFVIVDHVMRFSGGHDFGHRWPGVLYLPLLFAAMFPWSVFLPGTVIRLFPWPWRARADRPAELFLWCAAAVPLAIVCMSTTKLVNYVLPAIPPLAVLVGGLVSQWTSEKSADKLLRVGMITLSWLLCMACAGLVVGETWLGCLDTWIVLPLVLTLVGVIGINISLPRDARPTAVLWAVVLSIGLCIYAMTHTAVAVYSLVNTSKAAGVQHPDDAASAPIRDHP